MTSPQARRTYNQDHVARKHARQTPREHLLDLELSVGNEPRSHRVGQSVFLDDRSSPGRVAGFRSLRVGQDELPARHRRDPGVVPPSTLSFQKIVGEATGHPVAVFQRIDQAGYRLPIDERVLADTDTLMVFGLDHLVAEQEAEPGEIDAIREWLKREGPACCSPHTTSASPATRSSGRWNIRHHGDELVPRQQRFSQYTRSLMKALDVPVLNQWGLRPAVVKGTKEIAPLTAFRDLDKPGLLNDVTTFNFHLHLPHYEVTTQGREVGACPGPATDRPRSPHPFTPPATRSSTACSGCRHENRAGDILLIDSTHFTTLFGGTDSLASLWRNLALSEMTPGAPCFRREAADKHPPNRDSGVQPAGRAPEARILGTFWFSTSVRRPRVMLPTRAARRAQGRKPPLRYDLLQPGQRPRQG